MSSPLLPFSSEELGTAFLTRMRSELAAAGVPKSRLPPWVEGARVRTGWVKTTLIFVIEDSPGSDLFAESRNVQTDLPILLDEEDFAPRAPAPLTFGESGGSAPVVVVAGPHGKPPTSFDLVGSGSGLFACGLGYHGPLALTGIFIRRLDEAKQPIGVRFVPLAIFAHLNDLTRGSLWDLIGRQCFEVLRDLSTSSAGQYYEDHRKPAEVFAHTKQTNVIVLGKDTGPELLRLKQLRDALKGRGYGASFIKELPEIPMMSNEEKVRMWSMASRFCVMIDDVPSGHIAEYQILKSQRSILALLRPRGRGSTFMIGDDPIVDTNHIAVFEFDHTPLAKVDEAIEWAEAIAKTREDGYGAAYPWRHTTPR